MLCDDGTVSLHALLVVVENTDYAHTNHGGHMIEILDA